MKKIIFLVLLIGIHYYGITQLKQYNQKNIIHKVNQTQNICDIIKDINFSSFTKIPTPIYLQDIKTIFKCLNVHNRDSLIEEKHDFFRVFNHYINDIEVVNSEIRFFIKDSIITSLKNNLYLFPIENIIKINIDSVNKIVENFYGANFNKNWNIENGIKIIRKKETDTLIYVYKIKVNTGEYNNSFTFWIDATTGEIIQKDLIYVNYSNALIDTTKIKVNSTGYCVLSEGYASKFGYIGQIHTKKINNSKFLLEDECDHTYHTASFKTQKKNYLFGYNYSTTSYENSSNIWNSNSVKTGVQSHYVLENVLNYWGSYFGRNSIDNKGQSINIITDESKALDARYNQNNIYIGVGSNFDNNYDDLNNLEIIGHEFTHGVVANTSKLIYQKESGALNESFADIFGIAFKHWFHGTNDNAYINQNKWNLYWGDNITVLRSFYDPKSTGQPTYYKGSYWQETTNCTPTENNDACGVHYNSGVQNYWFYLLVNGGSGNNEGRNFNVNSIGYSEALNIVYNTLIVLSPTANYSEVSGVSIQVSENIYGANSQQACAVKQA